MLGILDKETQTRLLRDDVELTKVVSYCQSIERAESNRRTLTTANDVDKSVHEVMSKSSIGSKYTNTNQSKPKKMNESNQKQWNTNQSNDHRMGKLNKGHDKINCNRCGLKHVYKNCPAYGKCCNNCSGYHHFANMCKKKIQYDNKFELKKAQEVKIEIREEDNTFSIESVHKLWSIKNEWCKIFEINKKKIEFKLDSGTEVNTLSEQNCKYLGLHKLIKDTKVTLEVFGGFKVKPMGQIKTILTLDDKSIETKFIVIEETFKSRSIIGLPILKEFKLLKNVDAITIKDDNEINKDMFIKKK